MASFEESMTDSKLLDYPFDLYQRTRDIREIVQLMARETGKEKLKILDVGGYRIDAEDRDDLLLREFLPGHEIVSLDLMESDIPGYIQGDGTRLPFKENTFDVAVSSDVFEHVPGDLRDAFVANLVRVSKHFVILGAPFYSEKNELAEHILFEYIRKVLHAEQEQLKEHIENRLPDREQLETFLGKQDLPFICLSSGNLENWLTMMMVKHYLMTIPGSEELHAKLDRFYNISCYESDHGGEGYRKIYVVAKDSSLKGTLQNLTDHFGSFAQQGGGTFPQDSDLGRVRLLLDLEELRTRRMFDEKDALIRHQAAQIDALNRMRGMALFKFIRSCGKFLLYPFTGISRFLRLKLLQVWEILSGKRKHPFLSFRGGSYRRWIKKNTPSEQDMARIKEEQTNFVSRPLISIVVPVYNTETHWLDEAFQSVLDQVYDNWELCILNDGSTVKQVRKDLDKWAEKDTRIKVGHLRRNRGIAGASNRALAMAEGEYIAFMDSDDTLHPLALFEVVKLLNQHPEADVVYTDEDKLTLDGQRRKPVFKPGWDPGLFLTYNYINHLTVCRKTLVDRAGGFRNEYDWSQDYDLYLRITEATDNVFHIPKVLYHWRAVPDSSAAKVDFRTEALEKSRQLLTDTLRRRGINGIVVNGLRPGTFKIKS
ncbi:MAG: glycosyltransferase [bacterium]|nr:glycosyltransferase [bacterium]